MIILRDDAAKTTTVEHQVYTTRTIAFELTGSKTLSSAVVYMTHETEGVELMEGEPLTVTDAANRQVELDIAPDDVLDPGHVELYIMATNDDDSQQRYPGRGQFRINVQGDSKRYEKSVLQKASDDAKAAKVDAEAAKVDAETAETGAKSAETNAVNAKDDALNAASQAQLDGFDYQVATGNLPSTANSGELAVITSGADLGKWYEWTGSWTYRGKLVIEDSDGFTDVRSKIGVDAFADLRNLPGKTDAEVQLRGYHSGSEKGGGSLYWSSTDPYGRGDDDGVVAAASGGGYWVRRLPGYVSPYMYGAKATGITDSTHADYYHDRPALRAVRDFHAATGVPIHLEEGTFVADSWVWSSGATIYGAGPDKTEIVIRDGGQRGNSGLVEFANCSDVTLRDFTINGNKEGAAYKLNSLSLLGVKGALLDNMRLRGADGSTRGAGGSSGDGLYIGLWTSSDGTQHEYCENVTARDCDLSENVRQGFSVVAGRNIRIIEPVIEDITGDNPGFAFDAEPNGSDTWDAIFGLTVRGAKIKNCHGGVGLENLKGGDFDDIKITEFVIEDTRGKAGIKMRSVSNASVTISKGKIKNSAADGIYAKNTGAGGSVAINGVLIRGSAGNGVNLDSGCMSFDIVGNTIVENANHGIQWTYKFGGHNGHNVHHNRVLANGTAAAGTYHAINILGDSSHPNQYCEISQNILGNDNSGNYGGGTQYTQHGIKVNPNVAVLWIGRNTFKSLAGENIVDDNAAGANLIINTQDFGRVVDFQTGVHIGNGAKIASHLSETAAWDPPSLAAGAQQSTTITVAGVGMGDEVTVSFSNALSGTRLWGEVTDAATDEVTVYHRNDTGGAVDLASGTLRVSVWQH